jgi:hypothetical protein
VRVAWSQSPLSGLSLCDLATERIRLDEVGECTLAVDLHDRQPLPVPRLEVGVAADVDLLQLEPQLSLEALDDAARGGAEVAAFGVVEDDPGWRLRASYG